MFCLETRPGRDPAMSIDAGAVSLVGFDCHRSTDRTTLVLGHPYAEGPPRWVTARELAGRWRESRHSGLDGIHGRFALVQEDSSSGTFTVVTDRFGGINIFRASIVDRLLVSDSVEEIAARAPCLHLDVGALLEFLEIGHFLADGTHFEEVRRLKPATVSTITPGARIAT